MTEIVVNNGTAMLDGVEDITNRSMFNYIAFTRDGVIARKPHPLENRAEWTFVMWEQDDDRLYYIPYFKWEEVWYESHEEDAWNIIAEYEQRQYEMENAKDCGAFDILEWLE